MPEPEPLGLLLRRLRRGAALSQDELANRSGVSARTISDLERGQRASAHFETLRMLAGALDLSAEDRARLIKVAQDPWIDVTLQRPAWGDAARKGLPAPATTLIGRERDVTAIARELASDAHRLITLTGPGGVGKTRLALAAASTAAPDFPGGVAWIDLAPILDPEAVLPAIASSFGLDELDTAATIDRLQALLGDSRVLLVLDNFEQVIDAAPTVSALLAASPLLTVLVTSRAPLKVSAEIEYPVAPLGLPAPQATARETWEVESVRLFVARALAVRRDFILGPENRETVAHICRHLDGLPLAIELAASRLSVLSPRVLLDRLEQRLPLLTRGARDVPPRQQTMSNTIAWSYNLLDPDSRRLFRWLSVFVGGFTLETVEWVMGVPTPDGVAAVDALATLVENSLVICLPDSADSARFTMYETIREFGMAQLSERHELPHAYDLLTSYCQRLTHFGDGIPNCIVPAPWLAIMDQERGNIRAAHHHLARSNNPGKLFEFTVAFGHYLYNRGPIQEMWSWFEQALRLDASVSQPAPLRLQALYWASHLSSHLGLTERAITLGDEALHLADKFGDRAWRAAIVHCLALIHDERGHRDQAANLFEEELRLWEEIGVHGLSGFALMLLGKNAFLEGDLATARTLENQAAEIFAEMGGFGWVAMTKWFGGLFSASEGDLADAAARFTESIRLSVEHHTSMIHHKGLIGLAFVASELALYKRAAHLIGAAESCLEPTGQQLHRSRFDQSMYDRAISTCRAAMEEHAFDEALRFGAASDPTFWLQSGKVIKRVAAHRAGEGVGDQTAEMGYPLVFRAHVAD